MKNRADEIRKRIAKRRKYRQGFQSSQEKNHFFVSEEEKHGGPPLVDYEQDGESEQHPLIRKDWFLFQVMASICLFLLVGIMFKSSTPELNQAKQFVNQTFENEFHFATVANWYEDQFGKPLALLPLQENGNSEQQSEQANSQQVSTAEPVYAVPAAGRVLESFESNGEGIMIETGVSSQVEAINEGYVVFAGIKDKTGKTVEIQHADGSTTYYGNLESINVKLYDFVKARTVVGEVTAAEDGKSGLFYFAIKKGKSFIDPNKVIPFE